MPARSALRVVPALAALTLAASAGWAPTASAGSIAGFSARPVTYNPADPATRAYFKPRVAAGHSFQGRVLLQNPGAAPIRLRVYAVDGITGVTSGAVYGNRGVRLRKAGRWLRTQTATLALPAHGQVYESFVLRVPRGAVPGDHLAGLAFEDAAPARAKGRTFSVIEIFRVVVGVDVRVPGPAGPRGRLVSAHLAPLAGTRFASVVIGLGDTGRLMCKPRLIVSLKGSGRARTVSRKLDTILPGDTIPYPLPWPASLASGQYHVSAAMTQCGRTVRLHRVVAAGGSMRGLSGGAAPQSPEARTASAALPIAVIALISLPLAAAMAFAMRLYDRRRGRPRRTASA